MRDPPGALPENGAVVPSRTLLPPETGCTIFLISSGTSKRYSVASASLSLPQTLLKKWATCPKGRRAGRTYQKKLTFTAPHLGVLASGGLVSAETAALTEGVWRPRPHRPRSNRRGLPSPSAGSGLLVPGSVSRLERQRTHPRRLSGSLPWCGWDSFPEGGRGFLPGVWAGPPPRVWAGLPPGGVGRSTERWN